MEAARPVVDADDVLEDDVGVEVDDDVGDEIGDGVGDGVGPKMVA